MAVLSVTGTAVLLIVVQLSLGGGGGEHSCWSLDGSLNPNLNWPTSILSTSRNSRQLQNMTWIQTLPSKRWNCVPGSGRRRCALQAGADEEAAVAEFELDFDTVATEDGSASGAAASTGIFAMAFLALAAATALF